MLFHQPVTSIINLSRHLPWCKTHLLCKKFHFLLEAQLCSIRLLWTADFSLLLLLQHSRPWIPKQNHYWLAIAPLVSPLALDSPVDLLCPDHRWRMRRCHVVQFQLTHGLTWQESLSRIDEDLWTIEWNCFWTWVALHPKESLESYGQMNHPVLTPNKSSSFRVISKELNLSCKLNQTWTRPWPDLDLSLTIRIVLF